MEALGTFLSAEIIKALSDGNLMKFSAYLAIFLILWLEVHGMKKQLKTLNDTIASSFARGETRFASIEDRQKVLEESVRILTIGLSGERLNGQDMRHN